MSAVSETQLSSELKLIIQEIVQNEMNDSEQKYQFKNDAEKIERVGLTVGPTLQLLKRKAKQIYNSLVTQGPKNIKHGAIDILRTAHEAINTNIPLMVRTGKMTFQWLLNFQQAVDTLESIREPSFDNLRLVFIKLLALALLVDTTQPTREYDPLWDESVDSMPHSITAGLCRTEYLKDGQMLGVLRLLLVCPEFEQKHFVKFVEAHIQQLTKSYTYGSFVSPVSPFVAISLGHLLSKHVEYSTAYSYEKTITSDFEPFEGIYSWFKGLVFFHPIDGTAEDLSSQYIKLENNLNVIRALTDFCKRQKSRDRSDFSLDPNALIMAIVRATEVAFSYVQYVWKLKQEAAMETRARLVNFRYIIVNALRYTYQTFNSYGKSNELVLKDILIPLATLVTSPMTVEDVEKFINPLVLKVLVIEYKKAPSSVSENKLDFATVTTILTNIYVSNTAKILSVMLKLCELVINKFDNTEYNREILTKILALPDIQLRTQYVGRFLGILIAKSLYVSYNNLYYNLYIELRSFKAIDDE